MTDVKDLVRDLIVLTNPIFKDEPGIVEGLVEGIDQGLQRMILEDGKTSFSLTQKGKEYVEAMPFRTSEESTDDG